MQFFDDTLELCVLSAAEPHVKQGGKLHAALGVCTLECRVHGARAQLHALRIVRTRDAECRIDARRIKVGAHQPPAEGVDGADLGKRQGGKLLLEPLALGAFPLGYAL